MPGENIDLTSQPFGDDGPEPVKRGEGGGTGKTRRFLGIHFACCDVYARIYVNREGTAYAGNCPRCAKSVQVKIGPGGADTRFFTAY